MKLSIIFCYVSLMLYLDSITIIKAIFGIGIRKRQIKQDLLTLHTPEGYPVTLEYFICTEGKIDYWRGDWVIEKILVRKPTVDPEDESDIFDVENSTFNYFQLNDELQGIILYFWMYYAPNISATFHTTSLLYLAKFSFAELREHFASMVTVYKILHRHGYTGNGQISALGFAMYYVHEGGLTLRLTNLFYVVRFSRDAATKLVEQKNDLQMTADVFIGLVKSVKIKKKKIFFTDWSKEAERNEFLRELRECRQDVGGLQRIIPETYAGYRNRIFPQI